MSVSFHQDELKIDLPLVRALVDRDHPELAALRLREFASTGSSNALFRLGDALLVRLPRQPGGSAVIDKEARWVPLIAPHLPVAVPEIVDVGQPGFGYPERWSIVRWLDGSAPALLDPSSGAEPRRDLAQDLAKFVVAIGEIGVPDRARSDPDLHWYRGGPLIDRDAPTRRAIESCRSIEGLALDLDQVLHVWDDAMRLPGVGSTSNPHWYHGDLFAENLLLTEGRLTAILDFGGLGVGDPTIDLVVAWEVLDEVARDVFRNDVGCDESSWLRARAWALSLAMITFPYYWQTMPDRCASKLAVATAVLADARL